MSKQQARVEREEMITNLLNTSLRPNVEQYNLPLNYGPSSMIPLPLSSSLPPGSTLGPANNPPSLAVSSRLYSSPNESAAFSSMNVRYNGAALGLTLDSFSLSSSPRSRKKLKSRLKQRDALHNEEARYVKGDVRDWMSKHQQRTNGGFYF